MANKKIGILITNSGTPDAPTAASLRRYLCEFLSDKRVVKLPRFVWLPILYGLILPFRSKRSARLYQKIWSDAGSPMRVFMQKIQLNLQEKLCKKQFIIEIGMHYSEPTITNALHHLQKKNVEEIIVLPLYPQYSNTTTAATFDRVIKTIQAWHTLPTLRFIRDYSAHSSYIASLARSVRTHWEEVGKNYLLISFHGIPERFVKAGDIYQAQCEQTATLLANELALQAHEWQLCYQSQFGYDKWLQPSTQNLFRSLPSKKNITTVDVICPGFSVDCLETQEEIAITGKHIFMNAGGKTLRYIPALNDSALQIELLKNLIEESI